MYGWCRVDTILSEECKQIHNMPITTPGLDETREDNCWDERSLGNRHVMGGLGSPGSEALNEKTGDLGHS